MQSNLTTANNIVLCYILRTHSTLHVGIAPHSTRTPQTCCVRTFGLLRYSLTFPGFMDSSKKCASPCRAVILLVMASMSLLKICARCEANPAGSSSAARVTLPPAVEKSTAEATSEQRDNEQCRQKGVAFNGRPILRGVLFSTGDGSFDVLSQF